MRNAEAAPLHLVTQTSLKSNSSDAFSCQATRRRSLGIYYTPGSAAKLLADWAIRERTDQVLEPSFGGCALLSAGVARLKDLGAKQPGSQLHGYDIDPAAFAYLSRLGVSGRNFKQHSFLSPEVAPQKFNAVLANPPFVSWGKMTAVQRAEVLALREAPEYRLHGRASLWAYFLLHALKFVFPQGRLAFVLPNSVLTADYAKPLLRRLRQHFRSLRLINVTTQLFMQEGASERTCLLLCDEYGDELKPPAALKVEHVSQLDVLKTLSTRQGFRSVGTQQSTSRGVADRARATQFKRPVFKTLSDHFKVTIGEVVGDVKFFVRPAEVWKELGIRDQHLVPLLTRSSMIPGITTDLLQPESEEVLHLLLPGFRKPIGPVGRLLDNYDEGARQKNSTFKRRIKWYRCSYDTSAVAFMGAICTHFPKIIQNTSQISCSNSLYKITPLEPVSPWSKWLAIISFTTPFQLSAEQHARIRGNGGLKLEPSDARKLAIPARLPEMPSDNFGSLMTRVNQLVIAGSLHEATQLADQELLLKTGLLSPNRLAELRRRTSALRSIRRVKRSG